MNRKQTIASMATSKKLTKSALFEVVEDIIENGNPTDSQLADLYGYFIPSVTKIKTPFHWLVKARGNKDVRYYLNHVYSDGERTFSTDGHRAHVLNEARPAGFYDDNDQFVHDDEWAKFPDIDRVMPSGVHYVIDVAKLPLELIDGKTAVYVMPDGMGMNKQYIDQACGMPDFKLEYYEDSQCCKVTYKDAQAVVMGRRIN